MRVLYGLLALANAAVLGLAALAYAARWIDPRAFWLPELLAVVLPLLGVAVAACALYWLAQRRWGVLAVHAVLLVLIALRLFPLQRLLPNPAPGPDDLVLMTFNVPRFGQSAERLEADVARLFRAERPDVAILQEVGVWQEVGPRRIYPSGYLRTTMDSLQYRMRMPEAAEVTSQPLLIRHEAAAAGFVVHEDERRPLALFPGDEDSWEVVRTRFEWKGREAVLYNVHLRTFGDAKPWEDSIEPLRPAFWARYLRQYRLAFQRRAAEAAQLRAWIEEEPLPVIVAGDFNATADNWAYHHVAQGLRDGFAAVGAGWGGTYHATRPLVRIDYVLYSPVFRGVEAYVPDVEFSDHRPLVVRLRWRDGDPHDGQD